MKMQKKMDEMLKGIRKYKGRIIVGIIAITVGLAGIITSTLIRHPTNIFFGIWGFVVGCVAFLKGVLTLINFDRRYRITLVATRVMSVLIITTRIIMVVITIAGT